MAIRKADVKCDCDLNIGLCDDSCTRKEDKPTVHSEDEEDIYDAVRDYRKQNESKKKIKDYAHLYTGCGIRRHNYILKKDLFGELFSVRPDYILVKHIMTVARVEWDEDFKLVLRSLSDMTEEDIKHIESIEYQMEGYTDFIVTPLRVKYLLSRHFDLFGLIEAGLAIKHPVLPQIV
jgi:hypothetical protein